MRNILTITKQKLKLEQIFLFLTSLCNLRCDMCDIWKLGEYGPSLNVITRILEEAKELGAGEVSLGGGEPFMRDDILEVIEYAHNLGYIIKCVTNATLLNEKLVTSLSHYMDRITISLEGQEDCHDSIRGKGTYQKAIAAIKMLREKKFLVSLIMVVSKHSYHYMKELVDVAKERDIFSIGYQPFTKRVLRLRKENWEKYVIPEDEIDNLAKMVDETVYYARKKGVIISSLNMLQMMPEYFRLKEKTYPSNGCTIPFQSISTNLDGSVSPCMAYSDFNVGNIKQTSLSEIWYGEKFERARQMARNKLCRGCLSACSDLKSYKIDNHVSLFPNLANFRDSHIGYLRKINKGIRQQGFKCITKKVYRMLKSRS